MTVTRIALGNGKYCYTPNCRLHKSLWDNKISYALSDYDLSKINSEAEENFKAFLDNLAEREADEKHQSKPTEDVLRKNKKVLDILSEEEPDIRKALVFASADFLVDDTQTSYAATKEKRYSITRKVAVRKWFDRVEYNIIRTNDKYEYLHSELNNLFSYYDKYYFSGMKKPISYVPDLTATPEGQANNLLSKIKKALRPTSK